jgi:hypothetical protein
MPMRSFVRAMVRSLIAGAFTLAGCASSGATSSGLHGDAGVSPAADTGTAPPADAAAPAIDDAAEPGTELLHADFEQRSAGPYSMDLIALDFGVRPSWNDGVTQGRAAIVEETGGHFLRVTYVGNQYGPDAGGVQFMIPLSASYPELYLSYRVRFAAGFQFVKGGKLPGLVGGTAPTGCITEPAAIDGGFSARMMWRTGGAAVQYMYTPNRASSCGDDYPYTVAGAPATFTPGQWHRVVHHLRMNTAGQTDGVLETWFDGTPALARTDMLYRPSGGTFQIDALYFSTFFGGSDTTWAPTADQTADFDDFVISTGRVLGGSV